MTMQTERQITQLLALRAAEWMETLKAGEPRDHVAFDQWLRESKLHGQYYLEMEALDRQIQALDSSDRPDIEAILASAAANVRRLERRAANTAESQPQSWRRSWVLAAGVAGVAVLAALGVLGYRGLTSPSHRIATAVGEQRTVTLPDGSLIRMNVETALQIDYRPQERGIELLSGDAVFKVAHDSARPFIVHTPTASVRAVGTQFNVHQREGQATVVSVLEGRVQVTTRSPQGPGSAESSAATQSLGAGEEAQVTSNRIEKRAHPDVSKTVAWREGRIFFDEMPLEEMVREFNRYGAPVHLRVEGIAPGSHRFGGTFNADDPSSLADILEQQNDLIVERRPGEILIRPRPAAGRQQSD